MSGRPAGEWVDLLFTGWAPPSLATAPPHARPPHEPAALSARPPISAVSADQSAKAAK